MTETNTATMTTEKLNAEADRFIALTRYRVAKQLWERVEEVPMPNGVSIADAAHVLRQLRRIEDKGRTS